MFRLAERMQRIDASGIRRVFDLARDLEDPINLSIGQPDFPVPEPVLAAAESALRDGRNGYTPTQGIAPLRQQVIDETAAVSGRRYAEPECLITSGVSGGLFLALAALVEPGDEVIIPDPYFVMYKHLVAFFGGRPVFLDTYDDGFLIDPQRLDSLIGERTRLLLVNSPANPTGRILPRDNLEAVATVCRRHGLPVLSDEIYRRFAYTEHCSMAELYEDTILLTGYSKSFAMTGWRLGAALGPEPVIQAMAMLQQYSFVCAPSMAQYAALACPQVDLSQQLGAYRQKRDLMAGLLGEHFELGSPDGAFYLFVKAPDGIDGDAFVAKAIADNVLIIPGSVFSERHSHFRVCYTVADDQLRRGAEVLCRLANAG